MAYLKKFYLKTEDPKDMEGIDAELSKLSLESRNLEKRNSSTGRSSSYCKRYFI